MMSKNISLIIVLILIEFATIPALPSIIDNVAFEQNGHTIENEINSENVYDESPDCVKMYMSIEKYSNEYDIPIRYAFGIAWAETRYEGPFDWTYNPALESSAGALGPMQIMPGTARLIWGEDIPREKLISDIDFNVETSMKLLRRLYDKYEDWQIVFGCYNTGQPMINGYARKVYKFKE